MTIGGIVLGIIVTILIIIIAICIIYNVEAAWYEKSQINAVVITTTVVGLVLLAATWAGLYWHYANTASGKRALKTQDSNFNDGIEREITVYDVDGDILEHFQGRFDVDYSNERILFDDENGNRHVIYFKTGTVIINEI